MLQSEEEVNYEPNHILNPNLYIQATIARRGFFGSKPYSKSNTILAHMAKKIDCGNSKFINRKGS